MQRLAFDRRLRPLAAAMAAMLMAAAGLSAQEGGTITGTVVDAATNQPLPSAQVSIPALNIGSLTQQNGRFIILNVPAGTHTINVQRIGYRPGTAAVTVVAGQPATSNFSLTEEALALDEIIVTGTPGGTQRRAIGNTVTTVEVAQVTEQVAITNMQDLLSGRSPGIQFTRLSGNVGSGSPMRVRGIGSFNLSQNPLIYVDGIRIDNNANSGPAVADGRSANPLDDFNPEDIESVEIIKGPAAASLYGTEASAGVIQIITKKGRQGAPEFNVSIRQGTNFMMDPAGRLGTMWTCPTDPSPGPRDCDEESELVSYNMYDEASRYIREGYFPWPSENLYDYGHGQGYNLDVRGGAEAINYFLSANYDNEQGYVYYNRDETFRLRANVGIVFNENFGLDLSTGYVDGFTRFANPVQGDGGEWQDMIWSNGYYLDRITPFDTPPTRGVSGSGGDPRLGGFQEKIPSDIPENETTRDYNRFTGSATLRFQTGDFDFGGATANMTHRAVVGLDKSWDVNRNVFPIEDGAIPEHLQQYFAPGARWKPAYSENEQGTMIYERPIVANWSFDYAITGNLILSDALRFGTSVGAQFNMLQRDEFSNEGQGFASPLSRTINQITQSNIVTEYEYIENRSLGFYVQEEVAINDRLFLTGAVRFDDNSTFGAEAPAQTYPKLSAAWVVSEESFWRMPVVNSLRLRGAWGKAGRQPSALAGFTSYAAVPGPGGTSALRTVSPGNPLVEPEISTELELGFDVAFLDDRISGEFTRYWKKNEQALLDMSVPGSFGVPGNVDRNLGRIDNWGWEALVGVRVYESQALSFAVDLTADHTDNEIKDLGEFPGTSSIRLGLPYPNQITGDWVASGDWADDGRFVNAFGRRFNAQCYLGESLAPPGTPADQLSRYGVVRSDQTGPCLENQNQDIFAGRSFATHTFSVAPRITLFNNQLQLFALAYGEYGRTREESAHGWSHIYNNSKVARLENDPVWVASQQLNGTSMNDWTKALYDGDFWKLRELGARYILPSSLLARLGASRGSLALSARGLWTFWAAQRDIYGAPIADHEFGTPGLTGDGNFRESVPMTSINATLRLTF